MKIGVNVPNFGPGTDPGVLRDWAQTVEGLGFDLLMISDHVAITPDVAERYPAPFYEPFTTLSWLAGLTTRVRLGTTVLIAPYRHPLLTARMAANLDALSSGRFVLGVGVGWARKEFAALGIPFGRRGLLTDEALRDLREAWSDTASYGNLNIPVWVGGNSDAGLRRAVRFGDAWHPLRPTMPWSREAVDRLASAAHERGVAAPAFAPRIALRLTTSPVTGPERLAGEGAIDQIMDDLDGLRLLGADTVVLDPYHGDPRETCRPQPARQALATVAAHITPTRATTEQR
ncbi:LLM class flavin-dependent oxidoreductase [Streptomyces sp. NPDC048462]|uniref:LLM class flavin-dependent oxidoreductase n=1 Tax=Streptomyces sp. NPDC048462 TaxID=3365555 RepID=UPI003712A38B